MVRTLIVLQSPRQKGEFSFEIEMPARMIKDDLLSPEQLIGDIVVPDELSFLVDESLAFTVSYVDWRRDAKGIFLEAICLGE